MLQKWSVICTVGAFAVAFIVGGIQVYIWIKHGEIVVNKWLLVFGVLVVVLFISGLIHLKAAMADKVKTAHSEKSVSMGATVPPETTAPPRTETAQESSPNVLPDKRIVAKITPKEMCGFFKGVTTTQANKLVQPYIGKWLQVSGEVGDISDFGETEMRIKFDAAEVLDNLFLLSHTMLRI